MTKNLENMRLFSTIFVAFQAFFLEKFYIFSRFSFLFYIELVLKANKTIEKSKTPVDLSKLSHKLLKNA